MPAALTLWLPVALGGESAGGDSTGIAVLSAISIVIGYALIAALWYFVFRDRSGRRRKGSD
jgi:branched-subunit amino acid ABC-type transport system permease component